MACLGVGSALAEEQESTGGQEVLPTSSEVIDAIEDQRSKAVESQLTDPDAAESLSHSNLDRSEALELLRSVFGAQLEGPVGVFDELEVEKFLSPNVAVVAGEEPPAQTETGGQIAGAVLLDSSVPLRTEASSGEQEVVDLSLEHAEGEVQSANPLVEVDIPQQLGEGIELPGPGVEIEIDGAPEERSPSIVDGTIAFTPNVATDTDLALVPTPTGVETFTQLRSPEAPPSQTFELELPDGADLQATKDGGAAVLRAEETLVGVSPPSAIDATGAAVPVDLVVSGDSFTLTVSPDQGAEYPILVDPLIQTYEWMEMDSWQSGICNSSFEFTTSNSCNNREEWGYEHYEKNTPLDIVIDNEYRGSFGPPKETAGLYIATSGSLTAGDRGATIYTVPRYFTDQTTPTSFISHMTLSNLIWNAWSGSPSPYLFAGIWDPVQPGWVSYFSHEGLNGHSITDMGWQYQFPNPNGNTNAKAAYVSMQVTETQPNQLAHVYVGTASISLADNGVPGFGSISGPSGWVDQSATPVSFTVSDSGLGIHSLTASTEQLAENGQPLHSWKTPHGCIGMSGAACPRTWSAGDSGTPALKYEPSTIPAGISYLKVVAEDPVGNKSSPAYAQIKVDHADPALAFSGSMTEQEALGTERPSYTLRVHASDGTPANPQSGAAKVLIKVDGAVVDEVSPGCSTKNCTVSREWTLDSSKYEGGQHTVTAVATDGVGRSVQKELTIELDPSPPSAALSGTLTEQQTLGTSRPRYKLQVSASAEAGIGGRQTGQPAFGSAFGSNGSGDGQLKWPADVAVDLQGNLWVADKSNNRIQKFDSTGKFLAKFGSSGSADGQLNRPSSIMVDRDGNLLVADSNNHRIQKFNPAGEFLSKFGASGSGNGQLNKPEEVVVDPQGNIWVADTLNGRVQKFNDKGEFLKVVDSGQLYEPTGMDVDPSGNLWVADWQKNRISIFDEEGEFDRNVGTSGSGSGQFNHPDALEIDSYGNVWVGDAFNSRAQRFDLEGKYVGQFGAAGSGAGQLSLDYPMGVTADFKGNLWITDVNNHRIQKWSATITEPSYPALQAPSYSHAASFGALGTGDGQFERPRGIEFDDEGNVWILDSLNARLQKFDETGQFLAKFGASGGSGGNFNTPKGLARDAQGNLWVADTGNGRIQKFSPNGTFLKSAGTSGPGDLAEPMGIDVSLQGEIFVADWTQNRVVVFDSEGEYLRAFGTAGAGNGELKGAVTLDVDPQGNVFVGEEVNKRVQWFSVQGNYLGQFGSLGSGVGEMNPLGPMGITTDGDGAIWLTDTGNHRVQRWELKAPPPVPIYAAAFGSNGGSNGQFRAPSDVAIDAQGNLWVTDKENHRLQKFDSGGSFLSAYGSQGSGNGQFNRPSSVAIDASGNILVADSNNHRIQKLSPAGAYISKFGSSGSGNGQLNKPEEVVVDPQGNIWVADTLNGRVQKFNDKGEFLKVVDSGQLYEPTGMDVDPSGNVWVADWQKHRLSVFDKEGEFKGNHGSSGSGKGQFNRPEAVEIDGEGNVWVGDALNGRVQAIDLAGQYVGQFGTAGSGAGQFGLDYPMGIAADPKGNLWITDVNNHRIQKWSPPHPGSTIKTQIFLDGDLVDTGNRACLSEQCPMDRKWQLDSSSYDPGEHTVVAKATDGLGNTTTKTLDVELQPDTAKPTLQLTGELAEAPEGWVEQESYGIKASASDAGGGVTSLAFRIDGEQVAAMSKTCADGGCGAQLTKSVDMSAYSGGAHPAEVIATDGAGNTATKKWTINVDPEGHITATEAEETLEAADATSEGTVVAPTNEVTTPEERADGNNPELVEENDFLESRGGPTRSLISIDPEEGFTINLPESTLHIEPKNVSEEATAMDIAAGAAAIAGNTSSHVDTVVRPIFNGVTSFQSIRDSSAPESYFWHVSLAPGQTLQQADPKDAEVVYEDGVVAMLIAAEQAHDAVGTEVPTTLTVVDEETIRLTVPHKQGGYVYPIVAGAGWEGGYTTEVVIGPKDEQEEKEERERIEQEVKEQGWQEAAEETAERESGAGDEFDGQYDSLYTTGPVRPRRMYVAVGAPEMINYEQRVRRSAALANFCASIGCEWWKARVRSTWFWNGRRGRIGGYAWRGNTSLICETNSDVNLPWPIPDWDTDVYAVGWSGPNPAPYGYGQYLNLWCNFGVDWLNATGPETTRLQIQDHLYGSGYQGRHIKELPPEVVQG